MSELDRILEGLIRQTTDGKLQWKPSVTDDQFVTAVGAIAIVVLGFSKRPLLAPSRHQLTILDEKGTTVEVIETHSAFEPVPSDRRATDEQAQQLDHLFVLARRSALNTQATLEKLAKALEVD